MGARRAKARAPASGPPDPAAAEAEALDFEAALERLEGLVERLEAGDLPLEEALTAFEQGVALVRRCAGQLERAEERVETLVQEGERWIARPFEEPEADG